MMMVGEFHGGHQNPYWRPPTLTEVLVEAALRGVAWVVTTVWGFRYLTLAMAGCAAAVIYIDRRISFLALLLLIPWVQKLIAGEWRRSLLRYRYWQWRRNWNKYSMKLGWARHYDHHAHTPTLKHITINDDITIVELQPLADHRISMWPEMADALRRLTNHALATWRETTPGHLQITLHRRPLPNYLPLDPADISSKEDEVYLGLRADGQNLTWDVDYSPHLLVAGATGGGKGSALRLIAAHAITHQWELTIINPKRSGEFRWTTNHANIIRTLDNSEQHLAATIQEMNQRQNHLDTLGVDTWHNQPWRRQLVIIDETPTLLVGSDQKTRPNRNRHTHRTNRSDGTISRNPPRHSRSTSRHPSPRPTRRPTPQQHHRKNRRRQPRPTRPTNALRHTRPRHRTNPHRNQRQSTRHPTNQRPHNRHLPSPNRPGPNKPSSPGTPRFQASRKRANQMIMTITWITTRIIIGLIRFFFPTLDHTIRTLLLLLLIHMIF